VDASFDWHRMMLTSATVAREGGIHRISSISLAATDSELETTLCLEK